MSIDEIIFDRENGKTLVIKYPPFDLMMSDSSLSFKTDLYRLSEIRLIALLKCLLILQSMPEIAVGEAAERLERIAEFYSNRSPQENLPAISASTIKGKLRSVQIRPPIILES
jgi:hypothetical protein